MDSDDFPSIHEFLYLADTADKLKYQWKKIVDK